MHFCSFQECNRQHFLQFQHPFQHFLLFDYCFPYQHSNKPFFRVTSVFDCAIINHFEIIDNSVCGDTILRLVISIFYTSIILFMTNNLIFLISFLI